MNRFPIRMTLVIGMLLLLIVLGSSAVVLAQENAAPAAPDAACVPTSKEVAVFLHEGYAGKCAKLKIGAYPVAKTFKMADNSITSFKVGSAVRVVLFRDRDFNGFSAAYLNDIPNLYYEPIGNDTVSSIRVEMKPSTGCNVRGNEIALFEDEIFGGACIIHNVGNFSDAVEIGLPDNFISSVKVGSLLRLVLYRNENFTGVTDIYNGNDAALFYDIIGNDTVSSLRVEYKPKANGSACKPKPNEVAFYEHDLYKGRCVVKQIGSYMNAYEVGLPDDFITSLKVGKNVKVVLYTGENLTGATATYSKNVSNLYYEPIGNDTVTSFVVMTR